MAATPDDKEPPKSTAAAFQANAGQPNDGQANAGRTPGAIRLADYDWAMLPRFVLAFAIGSLGSWVFYTVKMPLPIFLGALTFTMVAAILEAPIARPRPLMVPMRSILGCAVGTAFSPALLGHMWGMAGSLILLIPYTMLLVVVGVMFFERVAGYSRSTAFFASVPGGLTDVAAMAGDSGADQRVVTLVHAVRLVFMVFSVPVFVSLTNHVALGGAIAPVGRLMDARAFDVAFLLIIAYVGWYVASRFKLAGAPLVGPMFLSGVAHATGLTSAKVPLELLVVAQISLGVLLGCQFRGLTFREITTTLKWAVLFACLLFAMTFAVTLAVSKLTGFDAVSVLLAFSPGGQAELGLLALIMHLDVAYVVLHHTLRLAFVILGAQVVLSRTTSWRK